MADVAEALARIKRGCDELIVEEELVAQAQDRARAQDQARPRPDRARPAPRPHRGDQQAAPLPGPRPPGAVPDRRFHRHDRRPDRQEPDAPAAVARADPGERAELPRADVEDPRSGQDAGDVQFRMVRQAGRRGHDPARVALHAGAPAGARRFLQALQGRPADRGARAALSADAGLRLGGDEGRRGTRRHRPEIQPAGRARAAEATSARSRSAS